MINFDLAKMYNDENLTLVQIAEKVGLSKSTVQRRLTADGWKFDKQTGKYVYTVDYLSNEQAERELLENSDVVAFALKDGTNNFKQHGLIEKKVQSIGQMINRTYGIPVDMDRALKIKCAIEGKNATEIIREALRGVIEEKYYKF